MKKTIALILLCLLLSCAQAEETGFYTLREDIYYHINAYCGGREDMVPLSETAAKEFKKHLCPVCGPIQADAKAQAMVRGGTIVARIPQSWLDDPDKTTQGVFAEPVNRSYSGNEIHARLSELLHGAFYTDFMAEYNAKQRAETTVRIPDIVWENGELIMNQRHFGGVYYIVLRPKSDFEDSYTTYMRFFEHNICLEDGVLYESGGREWIDNKFKMNLDRVSGGKTVYNGGNDELKISVFHEMDTNIAVITEKNADKNRVSGVGFAIGGLDTGITMSGYMDGKDAVYCCVLTDAELSIIENGAEITISRENIMENADFAGTDFAVARSGDFYGIISRDGEFVLDAKYEAIRRSAFDHIFVASEPDNYHKTIFDAREGRVIAKLTEEDYPDGSIGYGFWPEVQNAAVFTVQLGQHNRIYDMETGELIRELGSLGSGKLNGWFEGPVSGRPDRLVSWTEGMRLMDFEGNFCSDSYPKIIPLVWNGEEGVFLTANTQDEYETGTDGREVTPDWRCGLINQDGEVLAGMNYVRVAIISDHAVRLTDIEGNSVEFTIG